MLLDTRVVVLPSVLRRTRHGDGAGRHARTTRCAGCSTSSHRLVAEHRPTHLAACWDNDWRPAWRVDADPVVQGAPGRRRAEGRRPGTGDVPGGPGRARPDAVIVDMLEALGIAIVGVRRLRGRRRHRHPRHTRRRCRSTSSPATATSSSSSTTPTGPGPLHGPVRSRDGRAGRRGVPPREVRGPERRRRTPTCRTLRGDTSDGLPGVAGIGEKTAAKLIAAYGSLAGLRRAIADGDPALKGAQRARLEAGADYLDRAPRVVAVAKDAPVPSVDLAVPTDVVDAALMSRLASEYGLTQQRQPGPLRPRHLTRAPRQFPSAATSASRSWVTQQTLQPLLRDPSSASRG